MPRNKKQSQYLEIYIEDMQIVLTALMKAGYTCKVHQDGESMDVIMIDYINPEFTGKDFVESYV